MNQQLTDQPENESPDDILQQAIESIGQRTDSPRSASCSGAATLRALDGFEEPLQGSLPFVPKEPDHEVRCHRRQPAAGDQSPSVVGPDR